MYRSIVVAVLVLILLAFTPAVLATVSEPAVSTTATATEEQFSPQSVTGSQFKWSYEPLDDVEYKVNTSIRDESPPFEYFKKDRDEDGFSDFEELTDQDLSVDTPNLLLQVSYSDSVNPRRLDYDRLQQLYENESGIEIVFRIDEEARINDSHYTADEYRKSHARLQHHPRMIHVALVDYVGSQSVYGFSLGSYDGVAVQTSRFSQDHVLSTLSHELGHQLGLTSDYNPAIDSHTRSFDEYPSVMNYNAPTTCYLKSARCVQEPTLSYTSEEWTHIRENLD